jgi:hypothetical protein
MADNKEERVMTETVKTDDVSKMNIYEKLSAISLEITNVSKNLSVGYGNSSYKAVSEGDVLAAVRPAEAKYHVFSFPVNRKIVESTTIEQLTNKGETKKNLFLRLEITYRFVNMDKPEEYIDIISYGDGVDSQDKAPGKAMTYGDKYALLKAYKVITGDDPDQFESKPLADNKQNPKPAAQTKPAKPISDTTLEQLKEINVSLEELAAYKKVKVEDLTDAIVVPLITAIKRKRAKKEAEAKQAEAAKISGEEKPETNDTPKVDEPVPEQTNDDDFIGQ